MNARPAHPSPAAVPVQPPPTGDPLGKPGAGWLAAAALAAGVVAGSTITAKAEDSDAFRTYVQLRAGEIGAQWGTDDHWGLSGGANLNRHWGVELALDSFEETYEPDVLGTLGEISSNSLIPQVRYRYPLQGGRLVPYVFAGAGISWLQYNDRTLNGRGRNIDAEDIRLALTGGIGIEYFIADNIAFGLEGKYMWMDPLDATVDGARVDWDMSAMMFSFGFRVYFCENEPRPLVSASNSDVTRLYFGMRFGGSVLTDEQWGDGVRLETEAQALGGTVNQFAGLSIGADFGRNWGAELVLGGGEWVPIVDGIGGIGEYAVVSATPVVRYRFPIRDGRWVPYALAGGGFSYHEFNDQRLPGALARIRETKGFSPVAVAGGGVEYFFARNVSVGGEARWHYTWDHTIQVNGGPIVEGDFSDFQFMLTLRLYLLEFGQDRKR